MATINTQVTDPAVNQEYGLTSIDQPVIVRWRESDQPAQYKVLRDSFVRIFTSRTACSSHIPLARPMRHCFSIPTSIKEPHAHVFRFN